MKAIVCNSWGLPDTLTLEDLPEVTAGPGQIVVSSTVKDLMTGTTLTFTPRGSHRLGGTTDEWALFTVDDQQTTASPSR